MCMPQIITGKDIHNRNTRGKANKARQYDTIILFPCLHLYLIKKVVQFLSHFVYNQCYKEQGDLKMNLP